MEPKQEKIKVKIDVGEKTKYG